jgi:hypothetical protein
MLPMILKRTADSTAFEQTYGFHVDWDARATAAA